MARLVSCYLLLISTPRHTDHSLRAILRSLSESQYLWNFLAHVFGLTIFLSMRRSERISARVSTLLLSASSCENFHSMARFSGVSSRASESDVTGKSAIHNHGHNISNLSKCVTGGLRGVGDVFVRPIQPARAYPITSYPTLPEMPYYECVAHFTKPDVSG